MYVVYVYAAYLCAGEGEGEKEKGREKEREGRRVAISVRVHNHPTDTPIIQRLEWTGFGLLR